MTLPVSVSVWPILSFRAYQAGYSHGYRLWILARAIDKLGSGKVMAGELRAAAKEVGLSTKDYNRYLRSAKKAEMLTSIQVKSKTQYLIKAVGKVAQSVNCFYIGPRKALLPLREIFARRWLSLMWSGWIATLLGRPISRDKMRELTGVSPRAQTIYNKERGITSIPHYAHDESKDPTKVAMLCDFPREQGGRPAAFIYKESKTGKEIVTWRLPDSRQSPHFEDGKGRTRKINRAIRFNEVRQHLSLMRQVNVTPSVSIPVYPVRLFQPNPANAINAIILLQDKPRTLECVHEIYISKAGGYQCQQWEVLHTNPEIQSI